MKIETHYYSGIYQLRTEQFLNAPLEEVWNFFSNPKNLDRITPEEMAFKITSSSHEKMKPGQIISYKIQVLPLVKSSWITEITHCENPNGNKTAFFVDEQRFGPYKMWHHEHHFEETPDKKVKMTDIISYKLPLGFLGKCLAGKIIRKKVEKIFQFRFQTIEEIF